MISRPDCPAVQTQHRDLGLGLDEDLEALGRDPQEEAAEEPHRVIGVLVGGAAYLDLQRPDDLDGERLRRQLEGLPLGQQVELAVRGVVLEEERGAELAIGGLGADLTAGRG
jgi:hypothetical protein